MTSFTTTARGHKREGFEQYDLTQGSSEEERKSSEEERKQPPQPQQPGAKPQSQLREPDGAIAVPMGQQQANGAHACGQSSGSHGQQQGAGQVAAAPAVAAGPAINPDAQQKQKQEQQPQAASGPVHMHVHGACGTRMTGGVSCPEMHVHEALKFQNLSATSRVGAIGGRNVRWLLPSADT